MSPVFGRMSTKRGYRRVLMISTALVAFGALFYAVADGVFQVFLSQVFLGTFVRTRSFVVKILKSCCLPRRFPSFIGRVRLVE